MGCREGREKYVSLIARCMNNVKEKYLRDLHGKFIKKEKQNVKCENSWGYLQDL